MDLTEQVVSLELARRLKALGVPQESMYWWQEDGPGNDHWAILQFPASTFLSTDGPVPFEKTAAHNAGELGRLWPELARSYRLADGRWQALAPLELAEARGWGWREPLRASGETEADARAALLVQLIEGGWLRLEGESP
ncbi:MAG TPA: hypothetical protein VFI42_14750 [Thermomicrobiaceae bacterium]|nr:hypothetical protein [Thermomicrobiaceae bacterium]